MFNYHIPVRFFINFRKMGEEGDNTTPNTQTYHKGFYE